MNERIRELAEQIVCFEQDMDGSMEPNENGQWIRADDLAKFAELIVRECISALDEKIYRSIDGDGDEIWADLILKEHFGVEE